MIDVERLAELRNPSVLISSPLTVAAAAQRLRQATDEPSGRADVHGHVDFEDAVELWVPTSFMPWKLRAELVAGPTGCELRGAIGPFSHLAKAPIRYGLFLLWIVASLAGALVAVLAGARDDAHGAAWSALAGVIVAVLAAGLDYLALRLNRPAQEHLLAWAADTLDAGPPEEPPRPTA